MEGLNVSSDDSMHSGKSTITWVIGVERGWGRRGDGVHNLRNACAFDLRKQNHLKGPIKIERSLHYVPEISTMGVVLSALFVSFPQEKVPFLMKSCS